MKGFSPTIMFFLRLSTFLCMTLFSLFGVKMLTVALSEINEGHGSGYPGASSYIHIDAYFWLATCLLYLVLGIAWLWGKNLHRSIVLLVATTFLLAVFIGSTGHVFISIISSAPGALLLFYLMYVHFRKAAAYNLSE